MNTLGLDFSLTSSGYAVAEGDGSPRARGTIKPKVRGPQRLMLIRDEAISLVDIYRPAFVVIEGMSYASFNTDVLAELHGTFKTALYEFHNQLPVIVAPSSLKKFVTGSGKGSGKAGKAAMRAAILQKWGYRFDQDDEADAYGLARIGLSLLEVGGSFPQASDFERVKDKAEREALKTIYGSKMNQEVFT